MDGIEARNANSPWNGTSAIGYFKAGSGGKIFDFVGVFNNEATFNVAKFYSDNPLDGNAHIRTDIILARTGDRLGLNTDQYVFQKGTDIFASGIPDLPRADSRNRDRGLAKMLLGFGPMAKGTAMIVAGFAGSGPSFGATLAAVVPGVAVFAGGAVAFADGTALVVDYTVALKRSDYVQNRSQMYAP